MLQLALKLHSHQIPFIFDGTPFNTPATAVDASSDNFHCGPVHRLKLSLAQLFGCRI